MTCTHHPLGAPTGLTCTRVEVHEPGHGCSFVSGGGDIAGDPEGGEDS